MKITRIGYTDFAADLFGYDGWHESRIIWSGIAFRFSGFALNLDFSAFVKATAEKIVEQTPKSENYASCSAEKLAADDKFSGVLKISYRYYKLYNAISAVAKTNEVVTFKTFDSISISVADIYSIHLMPESYPVFWRDPNYSSENSNSNYALYILEVAKASDDRWQLSLSLASVGGGRYYLGGRFKLYVKKGDEIPLCFYSGKDATLTARVKDIGYNYVTLQFS